MVEKDQLVTEMVSSAYHGSPAFPWSPWFVRGVCGWSHKSGLLQSTKVRGHDLDIERPSPGVKI
jgi:hypothetical protein